MNTLEATSTASPRTRPQGPDGQAVKVAAADTARPKHTTATPIRPPSPAIRPGWFRAATRSISGGAERTALYSAPATHTTTTKPTHTAMPTPRARGPPGLVGGGERRHDDSGNHHQYERRCGAGSCGTLQEGPADRVQATTCRPSRIIGGPRQAEHRYRGPEQHQHLQHYSRIIFRQTPGCAPMIGYHSPGRR